MKYYLAAVLTVIAACVGYTTWTVASDRAALQKMRDERRAKMEETKAVQATKDQIEREYFESLKSK